MKRMLTIIAVLSVNILSAQRTDTITTSANLLSATVYYGYGAELQHAAKAPLLKGMQQVLIDNIALQPDANTIQIGCPEDITILSYYFRPYAKPLVKPAGSPDQQRSNDTIRQLQLQVNAVVNDHAINEDLLRRITGLIENNFVTDNKKQLSSAELIKLTEYYTSRVRSIRSTLYALQLKRTSLNEQISEITNRLAAAAGAVSTESDPKPTGQLVLQIMAQRSGSANFDINYFTRNAGWIPAYDIRVKTLDNSLKLVYKASVQQTTGLYWKDIRLNLSTSNPNLGTLVPALAPTFLQLYVPQLYNTMIQKQVTEDAPATLSEVVITDYGSQNKSKDMSASFNRVSDYMTLKESQLNTNFEISLPYDIPSDGKAYRVVIKDEYAAATYKHFAVPKLDSDAFLVAGLSRWDSLGLLPGEANIIMDNVYLGKSFIDPSTTADTLNLSLGRDKRIAIKRVLVKEFSKVTIKGDYKTEVFTYEITVKNNKKQPITISLEDQYPISKLSDLEVKLISHTDAENDIESGILRWKKRLEPGESKKFRFSYSLKYPKAKIVQETR